MALFLGGDTYMEYTNISKQQLKAKFNGRTGVVIRLAGIKYPDEVIRHMMITLQNSGFNITKITKPKVVRNTDETLDIVFMIAKSRADAITKSEYTVLYNWAAKFERYEQLENYIK